MVMVDEPTFDWSESCIVDPNWVNDYLVDHPQEMKDKIRTRVYNLQFNGTEEGATSFIRFLLDQIPHYVYSNQKIQEMIAKGQSPWWRAAEFFGDVDPDLDGKYGELILYLLVEGVLRIPLIVHKIKLTTNPNDQVKGSDGVFFGSYFGNDSILFGESKIYKTRWSALNDALKSLNKFHELPQAGTMLSNELTIASRNLTNNLTPAKLDYLSTLLDPDSGESRRVNIVHPTLIVYNDYKIKRIQDICNSKENAEELLCLKNETLATKLSNSILKKIEDKYGELNSIYLDFFFIPMSDVSLLKHTLYNRIHNVRKNRYK